MNLASRVRVLEEEKIGLLERLEEEEERAKELSRQIQTHTQQVRQQPERKKLNKDPLRFHMFEGPKCKNWVDVSHLYW